MIWGHPFLFIQLCSACDLAAKQTKRIYFHPRWIISFLSVCHSRSSSKSSLYEAKLLNICSCKLSVSVSFQSFPLLWFDFQISKLLSANFYVVTQSLRTRYLWIFKFFCRSLHILYMCLWDSYVHHTQIWNCFCLVLITQIKCFFSWNRVMSFYVSVCLFFYKCISK